MIQSLRPSVATEGNLTLVFFGLSVASLAAFHQFKLPVVLPSLLQQYGYDRTLAGGYMSIYAVAGLLTSLLIGRLLERRGLSAPLLAMAALFLAGATLTLKFPQSGSLVLLGRGLEGLGFAVAAIIGPVMANGHASRRSLTLVVGFTAAWIPIGQLAAALGAPLALGGPGWQALWWAGMVASVLLFIWGLILARRWPEDFGPKTPAPDRRIAVTDMTPARRAALIATGATFMLWSSQYFAYMTWLPQYLVETRELSRTAEFVAYVIPVTVVLFSCVAAGLLLHLGMALPRLLLGALTCQAAVWWTLPFTQDTIGGVLSLLAYGLSAGLVAGCLFAMPSAVMGSGARTAAAFGIVMSGRNLGVLAGPLLLALAFQWSGGWSLTAPIFAVVTTLCLPTAFLACRHIKAPQRQK